jgi:hypothetical protein
MTTRQAPAVEPEWEEAFHSDLDADAAFEKGLFLKEACIVAAILLLVLLREMLL